MKNSQELKAIYDHLLDHPGDSVRMQILADALEESGHDQLATAYRWAADNGKWPEMSITRMSWWGHMGQYTQDGPHRLPAKLFWYSCKMTDFSPPTSDGVDGAFIRLANALADNHPPVDLRAW